MKHKEHQYEVKIEWTGNLGQGTTSYRAYERSHIITAPNKVDILASSDPAFLGDPTRYNPEELLVASLSSCHMLWYLHLCTTKQVIVLNYVDQAKGVMVEEKNGAGSFKEVILYPKITLADASMIPIAQELHHKANQMCFIANSVNFPVKHEPEFVI